VALSNYHNYVIGAIKNRTKRFLVDFD
jgi:hypothetical protein